MGMAFLNMVALVAAVQGAITPEKDLTCEKAPAIGTTITEPCGDKYIVPVADAPPLSQPRVLSSAGGKLAMTLTVQQHRLDAGAFKLNVRAYCYEGECSVPGPMVQAYPGDNIVVVLDNKLADVAPEKETPGGGVLNAFRHANYTNLHTHGLHIDPFQDNVVIPVNPGAQKRYVYRIPPNHLPGTHWYHAHVHGATSIQVMGGLVGLYVVDIPDRLVSPPTTIQTFRTPEARREWMAMPVSYLLVSHMSLCSCNPTTAGFRIYSYPSLRENTGDNIPLDAELVPNGDGTQSMDVLLVNGLRQPVHAMRIGVWNRLEVANAVGDVYLELEVRTGLAFGGGGETACDMRLLSIDGVYLHNGTRDAEFVLVPPGGRVGIAVMCSTEGTYYLQSNPMQRASSYGIAFLQNLVTLSVSRRQGSRGLRTTPSLDEEDVNRPNYLQNFLKASSVVTTWSVSTRQGQVEGGSHWMGVGTDCSSTSTCPQIAFGYPTSNNSDRALENFPYRHVGRLCDIEDVIVVGGGSNPHPMHFHVNHFQIVSYSGDDDVLAKWGILGDWRDTIPSLPGQTRIRHALDEHGGNIMVHCHFLPHEDQGMMDRYWVVGVLPDMEPTGAILPCTASSDQSFCDSSVPDAAYDNAYPDTPGTCLWYRTSADVDANNQPLPASQQRTLLVGSMVGAEAPDTNTATGDASSNTGSSSEWWHLGIPVTVGVVGGAVVAMGCMVSRLRRKPYTKL